MKIGLVDVDGHNFPNLPIMKLAAYHCNQNDTVEWANRSSNYDRIYMSKIFSFTPDDLTDYKADEIVKGGTGYENKINLPNEVEHIYPMYSLYPNFSEAYGFLTRGCPRACKFCIVSEKEGRCSKRVADLSEFWRGQKTIKLLDPNLLACKEREILLQQLIDSKAYIDFTQGLDIRLADMYIIKMLNSMKIKVIHFAWDNADEDLTKHFSYFKGLTKFSERKLGVYVLTNFNSTHEQDLYRIYKLREIGFNPYVMIYEKETAPKVTKQLQRWVNNKFIWRSCERFEDYKSSFKKEKEVKEV